MSQNVNHNFDLYRKIILEKHGMIACPTDTVYGFFASAFSDESAQKIFNIKQRDLSKKLIVNVANISGLEKYIYLNDYERLLMSNFWPGVLSIILQLNDFGLKSFSNFVVGDDASICVRIPNQLQALDLLNSVGVPLISTSINLSGCSPLNSYDEVVEQFGGKVDLVLKSDCFDDTENAPSTIIDVRNGNPKILRIGKISVEKIENVLMKKVSVNE